MTAKSSGIAGDAVAERELKGLAGYARKNPEVECRVITLAEPRRKLGVPVVSALDVLLDNDVLFRGKREGR